MRSQLVVAGAIVAGLLALSPGPLAATAPSPAATTKSAHRAAASPVLPWIEDDHSRAVAEARARKLPIFVESWAPW